MMTRTREHDICARCGEDAGHHTVGRWNGEAALLHCSDGGIFESKSSTSMKIDGLVNELEKVRLDMAEFEAERARKVASIYDFIGQAKQLATLIAIERRRGREWLILEHTLAKLVDTACEIEASLGLDKLGRLADVYSIPLGDDAPGEGA
jgi:hypothetical protein